MQPSDWLDSTHVASSEVKTSGNPEAAVPTAKSSTKFAPLVGIVFCNLALQMDE